MPYTAADSEFIEDPKCSLFSQTTRSGEKWQTREVKIEKVWVRYRTVVGVEKVD